MRIKKEDLMFILLIVSFTVFIVGCTQERENFDNDVFNENQENEFEEMKRLSHLQSCGEQKEFFSVSPFDFSDFNQLVPLGSVSPPSHVFPIGHMYISVNRITEESEPITTSVVSPGDIWVTEIRGSVYEKNYPSDYSVFFSPCKEVDFFFGHLTSISERLLEEYEKADGNCRVSSPGGMTRETCEKIVSVKLSAGEFIGTSGGERPVFDFGAIDFRNEPLHHANKMVWEKSSEFLYAACPLDYFNAEIKRRLEDKIGEAQGKNFVKSKMDPICGSIEKDILGSAQGKWFIKGNEKNFLEDPHLALIPHELYETKGVFSIGTSIPEVKAERYYFDYQEGLVNRNFKDVRLGIVYCYELEDRFTGDSFVIILELTYENNLRTEKIELNNCDDGPWAFSKPVEFVR